VVLAFLLSLLLVVEVEDTGQILEALEVLVVEVLWMVVLEKAPPEEQETQVDIHQQKEMMVVVDMELHQQDLLVVEEVLAEQELLVLLVQDLVETDKRLPSLVLQ
jgi:hypothetical protein